MGHIGPQKGCTEYWSQGKAKLRAFLRYCGAENTQPSPSFTPRLGRLWDCSDFKLASRRLYTGLDAERRPFSPFPPFLNRQSESCESYSDRPLNRFGGTTHFRSWPLCIAKNSDDRKQDCCRFSVTECMLILVCL